MNVLPLLMIAVLAVGFWFFVVRPAKARQQAQISVINRLAVGDRVMTTAGLFGTITDIADTDVGLEIADGVVVRYVREAIAKTIESAPTIDSSSIEAAQGSDLPESIELPSDSAAFDATRQK